MSGAEGEDKPVQDHTPDPPAQSRSACSQGQEGELKAQHRILDQRCAQAMKHTVDPLKPRANDNQDSPREDAPLYFYNKFNQLTSPLLVYIVDSEKTFLLSAPVRL